MPYQTPRCNLSKFPDLAKKDFIPNLTDLTHCKFTEIL